MRGPLHSSQETGSAATTIPLSYYPTPQVYNARRFGVDLTPFPTIVRIDAALLELPEFKAAAPAAQPDADA